MKHFSKKAVLLTSLVLPFTFGAAGASATQITQWDYSVDNSFSDATFTDGTGSYSESEQSLSWGDDGIQSSVSINDISSEDAGRLVTNGGLEAGGTFVHNNQAIPASATTLASFNLTSTLQLFAATPEEMVGQEAGPFPITFQSFFTETYNGGTCVEGSASTCDDIFSLQNPETGMINDRGNFQVTGPSFTIDDYDYTVFLEIVDLSRLSDAQCGVANAPAGCIGFLTQENNVNTFQSNFRIESSAVSVPEPGSLALLGLGLVGLGVASRRK